MIETKKIFTSYQEFCSFNLVCWGGIVFFVMVVFAIAHCRNMHNIALHRATHIGTAAEALISFSAAVQEGSP